MKKNTFKNKGQKDVTAFMKSKPIRKIVNYYYFTGNDATARDIVNSVGDSYRDAADIWPELNLAEVVLPTDSLIFQDVREAFVDPADQEYLKEHDYTSQFQISFDIGDTDAVRSVMRNIMTQIGGRICSDTDDFEPSYTADSLAEFGLA